MYKTLISTNDKYLKIILRRDYKFDKYKQNEYIGKLSTQPCNIFHKNKLETITKKNNSYFSLYSKDEMSSYCEYITINSGNTIDIQSTYDHSKV